MPLHPSNSGMTRSDKVVLMFLQFCLEPEADGPLLSLASLYCIVTPVSKTTEMSMDRRDKL